MRGGEDILKFKKNWIYNTNHQESLFYIIYVLILLVTLLLLVSLRQGLTCILTRLAQNS